MTYKRNYPVTQIKFFSQQQKSYLKETTDFINFIEKTKFPKEVVLVSMDVTVSNTNIRPKVLTLEKALRLIFQGNLSQFNEQIYLQTHEIAMGPKMAVAFSFAYPR